MEFVSFCHIHLLFRRHRGRDGPGGVDGGLRCVDRTHDVGSRCGIQAKGTGDPGHLPRGEHEPQSQQGVVLEHHKARHQTGGLQKGNNMVNSLIVGCLKVGMEVSVACPEGYDPHPDVLAFARVAGHGFSLVRDPLEAAAGVDVVFTDVWASMGQEEEAAQRRAAFRGYQVNEALMAVTDPGCMVQHCLPAHRGEEITAEVFEAHAGEIFDEAENRLHAQKAVLCLLMGGDAR